MKTGLNEPFGLWRWGLDTHYGYEILFLEELAMRIHLLVWPRDSKKHRGLLLNPRCAIERQNK